MWGILQGLKETTFLVKGGDQEELNGTNYVITEVLWLRYETKRTLEPRVMHPVLLQLISHIQVGLAAVVCFLQILERAVYRSVLTKLDLIHHLNQTLS